MCMIDGCDEMYVIYDQKWISSARKEHKCGECGRTIAAGEEYRRTEGLFEGEGWNTNRVCHHCTFATRWLWDNCSGYVDQGVREDLYYHLTEELTKDHAAWWPMARVYTGMKLGWSFTPGTLMPLPKEIPPLELPV